MGSRLILIKIPVKLFCSLTRLTYLTDSVLPSNWNLSKIFAPVGQISQVHMIFLHAGRWSFLLLNL